MDDAHVGLGSDLEAEIEEVVVILMHGAVQGVLDGDDCRNCIAVADGLKYLIEALAGQRLYRVAEQLPDGFLAEGSGRSLKRDPRTFTVHSAIVRFSGQAFRLSARGPSIGLRIGSAKQVQQPVHAVIHNVVDGFGLGVKCGRGRGDDRAHLGKHRHGAKVAEVEWRFTNHEDSLRRSFNVTSAARTSRLDVMPVAIADIV